jgi:SAM-dependent methyltransferase
MSAVDFFRCVGCGATAAPVRSAAALACAACGAGYPVEAGIPVLVRDWAALEAEIARARAVRPDWYLEEQPIEAASPWRHHVRKRRRYVEEVLRHHLGRRGTERASRLLDLGCGDGTNLGWLAPFAERLYGSDYNLVRLARAQARGSGATLFLADILDYPAADNFFDVVFFNHVIEHIERDRDALREVARILKPGGLLVLGTPNEGAWWWQLAYRRAPEVRATTDHIHFYTARTIRERIAAQGLAVRHVEHLGWGPPDWAWDMKLRGYKILDDLFEAVGRVFLRSQASSLYVLAEKPALDARLAA